jgi:HK97 family phage portal protein
MPKMRFLDRIQAAFGLKELPFYPRDELFLHGRLPRSHRSYQHDIRDGLDSNVVMAPIFWIMRVFTEAHAIVQSRRGTSIWDAVKDHDLERMMDEPNPFYDGDALWKSTIVSYILDGNAYWIKVRNMIGDVIQLWYAPHWMVKPRWPDNGSTFISHYEYTPLGGPTIKFPVEDVVHFRFGIDPRNPRLGYGSLKPLMREVFIDEEAANFAATILENEGVTSLVVSPTGNDRLTPAQTEELEKKLKAEMTGAGKGGIRVFGWPVKVETISYDTNRLTLGGLRDISEERVCALIGIPAAVVGFGSGLQSTKVGATMRELMKAAWTTCIIPMQKSFAKRITKDLLPDFSGQPRMNRIVFDTSEVSAFQEDKDATVARAGQAVRDGFLRVDRAQEMCGFEVDPTQKVYLRPTSSQAVDERGEPLELPAAVANRLLSAAAPNGTSNGNGSNPSDEE